MCSTQKSFYCVDSAAKAGDCHSLAEVLCVVTSPNCMHSILAKGVGYYVHVPPSSGSGDFSFSYSLFLGFSKIRKSFHCTKGQV